MQDVHMPRAAQPHLQGDVCLPGGPLPAVGCHAHPLCVQQAQHQTQGDDRLDLAGTQQLRRGGAHALDTDEGVQGTAGLSLAQSVGVVGGRTDRRTDGCKYGREDIGGTKPTRASLKAAQAKTGLSRCAVRDMRASSSLQGSERQAESLSFTC